MLWVLIFLLLVLIPVLAIVLDSHVGRALAARIERPGAPGGEPMSDRLAVLEGEVERLSAEVRRLDEENRFLQQLIEKRPQAPGTGQR